MKGVAQRLDAILIHRHLLARLHCRDYHLGTLILKVAHSTFMLTKESCT